MENLVNTLNRCIELELRGIDKGVIVDVAGKPIPKNFQKLIEFYPSIHAERKRPQRVVEGTNMYSIRQGIMLPVIVEGKWYVLLGRSCRPKEKINSEHRIKSAGGEMTLEDIMSVNPVNHSFQREMVEEGFTDRYSLIWSRKTPLGVIESERGILQFFSGMLKNYPLLEQRGKSLWFTKKKSGEEFDIFRKTGDEVIRLRYVCIEKAIDSLNDPKSVINTETVEMLLDDYFWTASKHVRIRPVDSESATKKGFNLAIAKDVRDSLLGQCGFDPDKMPVQLNECRVYYSVPAHINFNRISLARMILVTDLFVYAKEFGFEELRGYHLPGMDAHSVAIKAIREHLRRNYDHMIKHDIPSYYIKK